MPPGLTVHCGAWIFQCPCTVPLSRPSRFAFCCEEHAKAFDCRPAFLAEYRACVKAEQRAGVPPPPAPVRLVARAAQMFVERGQWFRGWLGGPGPR
jgi:hypothetical protein